MTGGDIYSSGGVTYAPLYHIATIIEPTRLSDNLFEALKDYQHSFTSYNLLIANK